MLVRAELGRHVGPIALLFHRGFVAVQTDPELFALVQEVSAHLSDLLSDGVGSFLPVQHVGYFDGHSSRSDDGLVSLGDPERLASDYYIDEIGPAHVHETNPFSP